MRKFLSILFILTAAVAGRAQLSNPMEKFSLSATVSGTTNTDYSWHDIDTKEKLEEGRMNNGINGINARVNANWKIFGNQHFSVNIAPFYAFSNQNTQIESGDLGLNMPKEHHRFGGSLTLSYNCKLLGKPFTVMTMGTMNFSQHGYEQSSLMAMGMWSLKRSRETFLGVGGVFLFGTAVNWPFFPIVIYTHKFDDKWSIDCLGVNYKLNYHLNPAVKLAGGFEMDVDKFFIRTENASLPHKAVISSISERGGVFADVMASRSMTFSVGTGIDIPFYGNLKETGHYHQYMKLHEKVKPFVRLTAKYTIGTPLKGKSR